MKYDDIFHLQNAFRKGRLRGLLVHMSERYFYSENIGMPLAFTTAQMLLAGLRDKGVECAHIAEDTIDGKIELSIQDLERLQLSQPKAVFGRLVFPQAEERILFSELHDTTESPHVESYLNETIKPHFVCAGVYSNVCLGDTVRGIIRRIPKSRVFVATDATQEPPDEGYYEKGLELAQAQRICYGTTAQILGAFDLDLVSRDLV